MSQELWYDTRLSSEEMDFLWGCISEKDKENFSRRLAGNISKSERLVDKDNWFYETTLKKLTERMFYDDWNNYRKYYIVKKEPPPKFELKTLWVNYQKQHEFNPLHDHLGAEFSFVVFVEIPTHWKEQHALPISVKSTIPCASNFEFMWSEKEDRNIYKHSFCLSSEDEGRMLFFPAWLKHQVLPFYECKEERVTISGNIGLYDPNEQKMVRLSGDVYEEKKKILKQLENSAKVTKEELEQMKKAREKEE